MHQTAALASKYKSQNRRSPPFCYVVLFENKKQKTFPTAHLHQLFVISRTISFLRHKTAVTRWEVISLTKKDLNFCRVINVSSGRLSFFKHYFKLTRSFTFLNRVKRYAGKAKSKWWMIVCGNPLELPLIAWDNNINLTLSPGVM